MKISENYRNILADEIGIVREKMNGENDPRRKIYYYSALFGMTRRIYNLEFDPHVQFMDFIFFITYGQILNRTTVFLSGDTTIPVSNDFFIKLNNCLEKLENRIRANEDTYDLLEKIVTLAFTLDGNGYYLLQKGISVYTE